LTTRIWTRQIAPPRRHRPAGLGFAIVALCAGCATTGDRGQTLVPTRYQVRTGPFLVFSNTPIPGDCLAIRCLRALESDLTTHLGYRARAEEEPVEIYVLNDRNAYTHFLKFYYPELPPRRAFFLAEGDRRVVYTYLSDRLEEDLRHEATHALVRGCYGDLPLWLDEGLAEFFETRPDTIDAQDEHMTKLPEDLKRGWIPDLALLESLTDIHQLTPRDYREAWAWVHLMLGSTNPGPSVLFDYLNQTRTGNRPQTLSRVLAERGITGKTLVAHIETVQSRLLARTPEPPSQDQLIRFQDHPADAPVVRSSPPARMSLLRRIGSWLGL
jgi:hypothetical protein